MRDKPPYKSTHNRYAQRDTVQSSRLRGIHGFNRLTRLSYPS